MASAPATDYVGQIGETAGTVWQVLKDQGAMPQTKLIKAVGAPRDQVMQAIGWLARENKIAIEEEKRAKVVSLV